MARGNRQFWVATTLIALPVAFGVGSLSVGESPAVIQAVGQGDAPGQVEPVGGLLSEIFGGRSAEPSATAKSTPATTAGGDRGPVNWDGIPYHSARPMATPTQTAPIRDPGTAGGTQAAPRIAGRSLNSAPSSGSTATRSTSIPSAVPKPPSLQVPGPTPAAPPAGSESAATNTWSLSPLSRETSSRRTARRPIQAANDSNAAAIDRGGREDSIGSGLYRFDADVSHNRDSQSGYGLEGGRSADQPVPKVARREISPMPSSVSGIPAAKATGNPPTSISSQRNQPPASTYVSDSEIAAAIASELPVPPSLAYASPVPSGSSPQPRPNSASAGSPGSPSDVNSGSRDVPYAASNSARRDAKPSKSVPSAELSMLGPAPSSLSQAPSSLSRDRETTRDSVPHLSAIDQEATPGQEAGPQDGGLTAIDDRDGFGNIAGKVGNKIIAAPASSRTPNGAASDASLPPATSSVASELPGIRVTTQGPSQIMIRETRPYEVLVENRGSVDVQGLVVRASIPEWAKIEGHEVSRGSVESAKPAAGDGIAWSIDRLAAGQVANLLVQIQATRSGKFDLDIDWTLQPIKSVATVLVQEPRLRLTIDGPDEVVFGQSRTYQVRVLNPGDGIAPNVVFTLSPESPTPQTQRIGDIPAGKEAQFEVELTAQDRGGLKIHGSVTGDLELRADATKSIRVTSAKLEAVFSGPQRKYQDTEGVYQLELANHGTAASEQVAATLQLPAGVEYLGGIEGAEQRGNQLRWMINSLSPGVTREYEFRCRMNSTGKQAFAFDCRGTAAGEAKVAIHTEVTAVADLVMSVDDPPAPAPVGREVPYEIVIRNRGSKEATDVQAVVQFGHGIEPKSVQGHTGQVVTGQVVFDVIEKIAAGDQIVLRVLAVAEKPGNHRFRTEVRSGDILLVAEEATRFLDHESERISSRSGGDRAEQTR